LDLPKLVFRNVDTAFARQRKGQVRGQLAHGGNPLGDLTFLAEYSDVFLPEHCDVKETILIEGHAVRPPPPRRTIRAVYIPKQIAWTPTLPTARSINKNISGQCFVRIQQTVGIKCNSVSEANAPIDESDASGIWLNTIHAPVVLQAHVVGANL